MSFNQTTLPWQKVSVIFDRIIPEFERVSRAPDFSTFKERATSEENLAIIMQQEAKKKYKAIDTRTGDVFLMQNPALMSYQIHLAKGERITIKRQIPEFYMSHLDALALSKSSMAIRKDGTESTNYYDIGGER